MLVFWYHCGHHRATAHTLGITALEGCLGNWSLEHPQVDQLSAAKRSVTGEWLPVQMQLYGHKMQVLGKSPSGDVISDCLRTE